MAARIANVIFQARLKNTNRLPRLVKSRRYCSAGDGTSVHTEALNTPLTKPLPSLPPPIYAPRINYDHNTEVTVLENGMKVASEQAHGVFSTVGVLLDSGARYEAPYTSGITHFLEKLAFQSTTKYESRDHILQLLEQHGGICDCQGTRDTLIYAVSAMTKGLPQVMDILSEAVYRPQITQQEVENSQQAIAFEIEYLDMNPDPEPLLVEMIHAAAFRDNTLGLPKITPIENVSLMDKQALYTYMHNYHTPDRMVLAGVGMEHSTLVDLAKEYFLDKKPIWGEPGTVIDKTKTKDLSISQYTGGMVSQEKDLSSVSLGPTPMPELAHCVIGLESCSHGDDDFVAYCVLNMLLGGGGSFSAGGPGKGMYSRLYLNVLNRLHWIDNCTAYNHAYMDSGLFCIHASAHPSQLKELIEVVIQEFVHTQHNISPTELERAKTQLQSMLLMNLESRPIMFEDVARQVLARGNRLPATHYFDEIGRITAEDIERVSRRMLASKPSVAALGSLNNMPSYKDIQSALQSPTGRLPQRFTLFR